jgi:hypothetical protein
MHQPAIHHATCVSKTPQRLRCTWSQVPRALKNTQHQLACSRARLPITHGTNTPWLAAAYGVPEPLPTPLLPDACSCCPQLCCPINSPRVQPVPGEWHCWWVDHLIVQLALQALPPLTGRGGDGKQAGHLRRTARSILCYGSCNQQGTAEGQGDSTHSG